jgi:hypothetical protein
MDVPEAGSPTDGPETGGGEVVALQGLRSLDGDLVERLRNR